MSWSSGRMIFSATLALALALTAGAILWSCAPVEETSESSVAAKEELGAKAEASQSVSSSSAPPDRSGDHAREELDTVSEGRDDKGVSTPTAQDEVETNMLTTMDINGVTFSVQLADNDTAHAFAARLPMELSMEELNGNEKYCYLDEPLPSNAEAIGHIEAGDVMLYGDSCIVVFYESHDTSYSYARIGAVENPEDLAAAVGSGPVDVRFE